LKYGLSRRAAACLAFVVIAASGVGAAYAVGETTGTVSACATASVAAQTIAVNGTPISTVPAATSTQCTTTTYTIPTVTSTVTVTNPTTTTTTTAPTSFTNTALPTVSGTAAAGDVLTATTGTWSPAPPSFRYAWHRCDSSGNCPIVGTNSATYSLTSADVGYTLLVQVAPVDSTGTTDWTDSVDSAKTAVVAANGATVFDGRAKNMTTLVSTGTTNQQQSPALWDCLCFTNNDITLASNSRYTQVYSIHAEPGSKNPYNSGAPAYDASAEVSKIRPNDLGQWDWFGGAWNIPSGLTAPDFVTLQQFGYPTLSSPPLAIDVGKPGGVLSYTLYRNAGKLTQVTSDWSQGTVFEEPTIAPVTYGKWMEIIVGVKWATDNTGEIRVYTRAEGETAWTLRISESNTPTEQYGTTNYGTCAADFSNCPNVTDHGGLYFGFSDGRTTFAQESLLSRGLTRSTDLASAELTFP